jgi:arginine decarboxylase
MEMFVPRRIFLTKGVGKAKERLTSFEEALRHAKIAYCNLVRVSSIFPPGARMVSATRGLDLLEPGAITFCVMSDCSTNEPNRLISASVGVAVPSDRHMYGYLSEHHAYGMTEKVASDYAEDLAASMLATIIGVDFDPDKSYDEKKEQWKISGKIFRTTNVTQSALGDKNGLWTTVVAAAILLP